jgi:hypothetical protein
MTHVYERATSDGVICAQSLVLASNTYLLAEQFLKFVHFRDLVLNDLSAKFYKRRLRHFHFDQVDASTDQLNIVERVIPRTIHPVNTRGKPVASANTPRLGHHRRSGKSALAFLLQKHLYNVIGRYPERNAARSGA